MSSMVLSVMRTTGVSIHWSLISPPCTLMVCALLVAFRRSFAACLKPPLIRPAHFLVLRTTRSQSRGRTALRVYMPQCPRYQIARHATGLGAGTLVRNSTSILAMIRGAVSYSSPRDPKRAQEEPCDCTIAFSAWEEAFGICSRLAGERYKKQGRAMVCAPHRTRFSLRTHPFSVSSAFCHTVVCII